jgi:hypothetical protein
MLYLCDCRGTGLWHGDARVKASTKNKNTNENKPKFLCAAVWIWGFILVIGEILISGNRESVFLFYS